MRTLQSLILWVIVVAITVVAFAAVYHNRIPADPPGWKELYEKMKSGPTLEDILRSKGIDPATVVEGD